MSKLIVDFDSVQHVILRKVDDFGIEAWDLASPPRRLWGSRPAVPSAVRTNIDPYSTKPCPLPSELLTAPLDNGDTWSAMSKRSLARFEAFFLVAEDPQRRLDAREVVTLAHQVSLVRHILDTLGSKRVLIGDEVGLGKTVVAGLIVQELLATNAGLRVLYLAPARLVSNVGREFRRLSLFFREWKSQNGNASFDTDNRIIASIHRAVHPNHFDRVLSQRPWDVIIVDECHHLSDWEEGGGDAVAKYKLVRELIAAQPPEACVLLLSGTPHQAHHARFENLLRLLKAPGEPDSSVPGRVIYRTKEDVKDWNGNPLFPRRQVNPPIVVDLDAGHRDWLQAIHQFFKPTNAGASESVRRAAGWKCAQALQWATSSPNAGLGYLVRQALRAGWTLARSPLQDAIATLRPYRSGPPDEPVKNVYERLVAEIRRQEDDDDVEDIEPVVCGDDQPDNAELADLIQRGITLVRSPRQLKWERLWKDILEPATPEKVVLFAQPIETVMALAVWLEKKTGQRPAIIIGGQSDAERDQEVAYFRSPNGAKYLISSRAGGEGINLQFSRRLVHLDVPWNPMEMEQRVGRVHRFGSRQTILVDTIVVSDSRESHAWAVARDRLRTVASTLVAPDRFETVFSRVMCLIPPEDLQTVIISSPASPLDDSEIQRLASLVDSGFRDWQSFHERYAANQRKIRDLPAGLAQWKHLRDFLIHYGNADPVSGVMRTRFVRRGNDVQSVSEDTEVLRLSDGSLCFVGDFEGGLFDGSSSTPVGALGLNVPVVADLLQTLSNPSSPSGAAHLRWGETHEKLREWLGEEVIVLVFLRQTFHFDSVGGITDVGNALFAYAIKPDSTEELMEAERNQLFDLSRTAVVRVRPVESALFARGISEEKRLVNELRRPAEQEIRQGKRFAVWPILSVYLSA